MKSLVATIAMLVAFHLAQPVHAATVHHPSRDVGSRPAIVSQSDDQHGIKSRIVREPRFAFYDWLVKNQVFDERRTRLELVLGALDDRIAGRTFALRKSVPGIPDDRLYADATPSRDEARQLLMLALDTASPMLIDELFEALDCQGRGRDLVAWWLAGRDAR